MTPSPFKFDPSADNLKDRFIAVSEGQHYGNFPTLELAETRATEIAKVTGSATVIWNETTVYIAA